MKLGRIVYLWEMWHYFNKRYFGGKLTPPKAIRLTSARSYDGAMVYKGSLSKTLFHLKDQTKIMLAARLNERNLMGTLLHEMVHQYQQVLEVEPLHDPLFQSYCRWIERQTKFPLRTSAEP
jgi:hypothetical protein